MARRSGLSTRSLYDIESGQADPTDETQAALSEALRFPLECFYRPEIEGPTPESASFRALRAMTATERDAALAAGALAFELGGWIESRYDLPTPDLPDLRVGSRRRCRSPSGALRHRPKADREHDSFLGVNRRSCFLARRGPASRCLLSMAPRCAIRVSEYPQDGRA
jgi:transcriptional regulator with XRE-family HTH domain